jgi:hypothetical protein
MTRSEEVGEMSDQTWTPRLVEERLLEAADVLRRMPGARVQGYISTWPSVLYEFSDIVGQEPIRLRCLPPSAAKISRMEATLPWIGWLDPDLGKLVWARAERSPWKVICWRFGISRATANRRWEYGLSIIAWRLNGRPVLRKRSQRFVIERMREVSRL